MQLACAFSKINRFPSIIIFLLTALLTVVTPLLNSSVTVYLLMAFILVLSLVMVVFKSKIITRKAIIILFVVGLILRLVYVLYTGVTERQHDVELFGSGIGHSGYIEYYFNNFIKLPRFDVREVWQFYHPPLHHIICAAFMKVLTFCGMNYATACESLQMLSFLYSALTMLVCYKLFSSLGLKGTSLISAFAIITFHPTFIVFSGSINNDPLSVLFMLLAIYYSVRWYMDSTCKNIIKIALCVGLGMFTKLSAWMVAPGIAFLFLYALITKNNNIQIKQYIIQFLIFAVICVPIGMFWSIRNYVLYNVPITYIPMLAQDNPQYVGDVSILNRLFDFNPSQFKSVFDMWGDPYFEYNPTIGLLKTAMFGEWINDSNYPTISLCATVLFWLGVLLCILSVVALFIVFVKRWRKSPIVVSLLILFITIVIMYYYFCIAYPFTCTQNIRYAVPLIPIGAFGLGCAVNISNKYLKISLIALVSLFCFFSLITYFLIGI